MLFDPHRFHAEQTEPSSTPLPEYRPGTRANLSSFMCDMDCFGNMRESAVPFFMCPDGMKLQALMFEPFAGIYLGACGPVRIPAFHESPFVCDMPYVTFMLLLEGRYRCELDGEDGPARHELGKNSFIAGDWTSMQGRGTMFAQEAYCHVAVAARPEAVEEHFGKRFRGEMERVLHWDANGTRRRIPTLSGQASPDLVSSARRLLDMPKSGLLNTMELRSASLDFFTRMLRNAVTPDRAPAAALPAHDVLALTRLKERVERNCLEDVETAKLCAEAGMSESKANKAFKQLFGMTIASHVHSCKMQYAHAMLSSRTRNVSQCAFDIGYANIGHFIAAFRKHYGHTPGNVFRRAS